jgi:hypothetical protein
MTTSLGVSRLIISSVRESLKKRGSWKKAAIQKELGRRSSIIYTVISRYQATVCEDIEGWKRLSGC